MHLALEANKRVLGVKDVPAAIFIKTYAKHLKESGQFEVPKWAEYAKTSCAKELAPYDSDFLFIRAASIIRHLAFRTDAGVGRLRKFYGSTQNNGVAPSHHRNASGKVIRHCLQQLQKMDLLKAEGEGIRKISSKGLSSIDQVAKQCVV
eukprot:Gregarina_sp_Poly_1__7251@NODE_398_length_8931_cov_68_540952_g326_i0_p6_GENE_NODE_398_length_8931_cov_68_540952_g326_i0NODE_398_length_8931_cov_68_540952_g326_i0_p6_ORF_typecomplete_len149_score24_55Ribosomal_S19e/PF01090_19/4_1e53HTH_12/PF08461_10/0_19HrcA_DNAbdg/PF03444_15/0_25_NODE_398_length_8931_cov_68_540952_g326_i033543800